ncbi:hypothetical protein DFH29DRAFT_209647 [Suillus ampliporus]|nr:hypothetical protein DFH29DRAFT_209647 [Suillus ampliporus]
MLHQLYDIYTSCLDFQKEIVPSLKEKASACTMALSHLYCGRVLQEYPIHGEFLIQESRDFEVLEQMWLKCAAKDRQVLATAAKLSSAGNDPLWWFDSCLQARPDSVPEWLSHFLPYHFVTGRVDEKVENLAIAVISKLLSSPSSTFSPSTQIIANCTLLASVMVGVRFDKKDIGRIDKSSALPQLAESLWVQFQKALWACDGGNFDRDSTGDGCRAWKLLGVICRMLELAPPSTHSFQLMRNLDAGKKFYSRVRPSEQRDPSVSWATLQNLLHFTFACCQSIPILF